MPARCSSHLLVVAMQSVLVRYNARSIKGSAVLGAARERAQQWQTVLVIFGGGVGGSPSV